MKKQECRGVVFFQTSLGAIGLAWTPTGVCRVQLPHASSQETRSALFAQVELTPSQTVLENELDLIGIQSAFRAYLQGKLSHKDFVDFVPFDLSGSTPFAQHVYQCLVETQEGEVITYGALAERAGRPGASRFMGRLMATNPLPLIIPCHRVIKADGSLGMFMGGVEGSELLKQKLLVREGAIFL